MQNVISFKNALSMKSYKQKHINRKAIVLAKIHCQINAAENEKNEYMKRYYEAFNANKIKEMTNISRYLTEAAGKLSAWRKCENLILMEL